MSERNARGALKRAKRLPVKVLLNLSVEMHERLRREAELLQSNVTAVAQSRIARSLAQDDARGAGAP